MIIRLSGLRQTKVNLLCRNMVITERSPHTVERPGGCLWSEKDEFHTRRLVDTMAVDRLTIFTSLSQE